MKFKFANFPFERGEILFSKGFFDFRIFVNYKTKLKLHILKAQGGLGKRKYKFKITQKLGL